MSFGKISLGKMSFGKIRQRLWMAALAASMAAAAVGCARKAETPVQTTKAAEGGAVSDEAAAGVSGAAGAAGTEITGAAGVSGASGAETAGQTQSMTTAPKPVGAKVNGDTVNLISGAVADAGAAGAGALTLTTGRYPEGITFSIENAVRGFAEEPSVSQELTILYRGDIKDGKAEGVTIELIREKRSGDEEAQAAMATGKIISIGMSVITIETADGKNISFEQDPKPVNTTEGPVEGDNVTIIYSYQDEAREGAVMLELIRKAE